MIPEITWGGDPAGVGHAFHGILARLPLCRRAPWPPEESRSFGERCIACRALVDDEAARRARMERVTVAPLRGSAAWDEDDDR
mgnify:CR=1 FL=1